MKLWSPAFTCGEALPGLFTRTDANLSPPLAWSDLPEASASLALLCTDPDANPKWYHWVLWNIPPDWSSLHQRLPQLRDYHGLRQGTNSYRTLGYDGPQPPPGETHRYIFRLYALDRVLKLSAGVPGPQLERAMAGKILAQAGMKGLFTEPLKTPLPGWSGKAFNQQF